MTDGTSFLWRSELAGHPRDTAAWRALYEYAASALPRPGAGLADLHVILTQAVMGDDAALDARTRQMEDLAREGRYPSGSYLPELSRGFVAFERGDFPAAIAALAPLAGEDERIGGSRAQHDLIEFTLLKAYLNADRLEEARQLLGARRPGCFRRSRRGGRGGALISFYAAGNSSDHFDEEGLPAWIARVVTAHLPADLAKKLDALAERLDRPKGWIVKEAIASFISLEEKRHQLTLEAFPASLIRERRHVRQGLQHVRRHQRRAGAVLCGCRGR